MYYKNVNWAEHSHSSLLTQRFIVPLSRITFVCPLYVKVWKTNKVSISRLKKINTAQKGAGSKILSLSWSLVSVVIQAQQVVQSKLWFDHRVFFVQLYFEVVVHIAIFYNIIANKKESGMLDSTLSKKKAVCDMWQSRVLSSTDKICCVSKWVNISEV